MVRKLRYQQSLLTRWAVAISLIVAIGILGAGCSNSTDTPPAASTSSTAMRMDGTTYGSSDISPTTGMSHERSALWESYQLVTPRTLRVLFSGGDLRCFGYRALVTQEPSRVVIRIIEGTLPDAPEVCTDVGLSRAMLIHLDEPLETRAVYAEM